MDKKPFRVNHVEGRRGNADLVREPTKEAVK